MCMHTLMMNINFMIFTYYSCRYKVPNIDERKLLSSKTLQRLIIYVYTYISTVVVPCKTSTATYSHDQ